MYVCVCTCMCVWGELCEDWRDRPYWMEVWGTVCVCVCVCVCVWGVGSCRTDGTLLGGGVGVYVYVWGGAV